MFLCFVVDACAAALADRETPPFLAFAENNEPPRRCLADAGYSSNLDSLRLNASRPEKIRPRRVNPRWFTSSLLIVLSPPVPATYEGFADPKWKGRIAVEATEAEWMATLIKTWPGGNGMDSFRRLAALGSPPHNLHFFPGLSRGRILWL